jgi:hypothetical protein
MQLENLVGGVSEQRKASVVAWFSHRHEAAEHCYTIKPQLRGALQLIGKAEPCRYTP